MFNILLGSLWLDVDGGSPSFQRGKFRSNRQIFSTLPGLIPNNYDVRFSGTESAHILSRCKLLTMRPAISTLLLAASTQVMLAGCAAINVGQANVPPITQASHSTRRSSGEALPEPLRSNSRNNSDGQVPDSSGEQPTDIPLLPPPAKSHEEKAYNEDDGKTRPIDLPTALQLADARNPVVAFTREQVRQA